MDKTAPFYRLSRTILHHDEDHDHRGARPTPTVVPTRTAEHPVAKFAKLKVATCESAVVMDSKRFGD